MIHVELNPEIEARLAAEAKAHGLQPEKYVERLIEKAIETRPEEVRPRATIEEFRVFLDKMAEVAREAPDVPHLHNETFSREMIYGDHD